MSKVDKTMGNLAKCNCVSCPSFGVYCQAKAIPGDVKELAKGIDHAKHFEGMFCAFEKSDCIHEEHGCKCGDCEVAKDYHLHHLYYCLHNAEK